MKNDFRNCFLLVSIIGMFFSCSKNADELSFYTLVYEGNSSTGGIVPVNNKNYEAGEPVTIETQGSMIQTGFVFSSWNTKIEGDGTLYMPGDTFKIPAKNVILFAQWEYNPNSPFVTCAQKYEIRNSLNLYACNFNSGYPLPPGNSYWIRMSIGFAGENGEERANEARAGFNSVVMLNNDTLPMDKLALVEYNSKAGFWEVNSYHCTGALGAGTYNLKGTTSLNGSFYDEVKCKLRVE